MTLPVTVVKRKLLDDEALKVCRAGFEMARQQQAICEDLRKLGYQSVTGKPVSTSTVCKFMLGHGMRYTTRYSKGTPKPKTVSTTKGSLTQKLTELLTSNLSEGMKEDLIAVVVRQHEVKT